MIKLIKNTKLLKKSNLLINILIFILSYAVLYKYFRGVEIDQLSVFFKEILQEDVSLMLLVVIITLGFLNWLIESIKWRYLIVDIVKVSIVNSIKSVFVGIFFSLFIPNRAGDFIGRIFSVNIKEKGQLSVLTLLGSYSQLIATLFWGVIGCSYFLIVYFNIFSNYSIYASSFVAISWIVLLISFILYFKIETIASFKFFDKWKWVIKIHSWTKILQNFPKSKLLYVLGLSLLRYLVFAIQFTLTFRLVGIDVSVMNLFFFVTVYYLILTFIPTIVFTEIGVRGALSIYLFGLFMFLTSIDQYNYEWSVSFASILVWLVNIVLPSIVGSFYTFKLKFMSND